MELRRNATKKMKLLHRRGANRFFRCAIWASLSLYLFSYYLLRSSFKRPTSLHKTTFSSSSTALHSRAIVESWPSNPLNGIRVYVYDLPGRYNADWLSDPRCGSHLFAAEVAVHRALTGSRFRTLDPSEADLFFVPVYVSCNFSNVNGFPVLGHARGLLASAVDRIASELPFWNRSGGADHVFVASHDYGACFHAMEDVAIADGIPVFLKKSIILQTFGVKFRHPCQDVENVLIPPYVSPESVRSTLERSPAGGERDIWVFFRGKMEVHPKNISGRFYSKGVRTEIWHKFNRQQDFYIKRKRFAGYQSEIVRSVFCLCPLGWAPWSPRLVESVALGCVPVIIADGIRLPFQATVPWQDISLTVPEKDVHKLDQILRHVAATNLSSIQRNLWNPVIRRSLLFNGHLEVGDATWQVMESLSRKLDRSFKRTPTRMLDRDTELTYNR